MVFCASNITLPREKLFFYIRFFQFLHPQRFYTIVKHDLKAAFERLDKQKLVEIIAISPEITESDIETCFEENRYSR